MIEPSVRERIARAIYSKWRLDLDYPDEFEDHGTYFFTMADAVLAEMERPTEGMLTSRTSEWIAGVPNGWTKDIFG